MRADLVRRLVVAFGRGDDAEFRRAVAEIAAEERRAGHVAVAAALEREMPELKPGSELPATLRPIPRTRDDRPLVAVAKARYDEADLVLALDCRRLLHEVARECRRRGLLRDHGVRPRSRLLFVGPPGTGKSATAEALAAELSVPVARASLAAITSSRLGETGRNLESLVRFTQSVPCVLLLDEVDVLGQERGRSDDHGELRRVAATLLQLLEEDTGESVVVATSNHPSSIDAAMWRRFDDVVEFALPGRPERAEILALRLSTMSEFPAVEPWAERLDGASAADVEIVARESVRHALLDDRQWVTADDLDHAMHRFEARWQALRRMGGSST